MKELALALCALVAFVMPIGIYCLILASINRRPRPVLASGVWDTVALLFAASGFLLATVPMLFTEFYRRTSTNADASQVITIWMGHWGFWLAYYLFFLSGGWLMVAWRRSKTVIYNVEFEQFTQALDRTLAQLGLEGHRIRDQLVVAPKGSDGGDASTAIMESPPIPGNVPGDRRHAELNIESFPSMCHVTLHWGKCSPGVRDEIEYELHKSLENAAPLENPAAGWFLSVSGLILGAVAAVIVAMAFLVFIANRG